MSKHYISANGGVWKWAGSSQTFATEAEVVSHAEQLSAERSAKAGRPLDAYQAAYGLDDRSRKDGRTFEQRLSDERWQPAISKKPLPYADVIDKLESGDDGRGQLPDTKGMSVNQRLATFARELQGEILDRQESADLQSKHLADERIAKPLSDLYAIRESAKWDSSYSVSEILQMDKAIAQLEAVNGDALESRKLYGAVRGNELNRLQAAHAETLEQSTLAANRLSQLAEKMQQEQTALQTMEGNANDNGTT